MAKKHNAKWARWLGRRVRNEVARHTERDRQRAIYGRGPRQWRPTHEGWSAWPVEIVQVRQRLHEGGRSAKQSRMSIQSERTALAGAANAPGYTPGMPLVAPSLKFG